MLWYGKADGGVLGLRSVTVIGSYEPCSVTSTAMGNNDIFWYGPDTGNDVIWYGRSSGGYSGQAVTVQRDLPAAGGRFQRRRAP